MITRSKKLRKVLEKSLPGFSPGKSSLDLEITDSDRDRALLINGRMLEILEQAREDFPVKNDPFPEEYLSSFLWLEALAPEDQDEFLLEIGEEIRATYEALHGLEITLNAWSESASYLKDLEQ